MQSNQNLFVGVMNKTINENGSFQFQYRKGTLYDANATFVYEGDFESKGGVNMKHGKGRGIVYT